MSTKNILRNRAHIGKDCREQFVAVQQMPRLQRHGVLMAGVSDLAGSYCMCRSGSGYHVLVYTLAGEGWHDMDGDDCALLPGTLLVNPCGGSHSYGLQGESWRIAWVHLADVPAWSAVHNLGQGVRPSSLGEHLAGLMTTSIRDPQYHDSDEGEAMRDLYAQLLLGHLHRELSSLASPREREVSHRLSRVFAQVDANLPRPWSVAELAEMLFVSPVHFNRLCKQVLGKKPMQMVTHLRMTRAAELLCSSDLNLDAIAGLVGYANPFAFSAAFKRWSGEAPTSYRQT